jgi:methylenetetrahydrofolate reductase (NADPH)
MKVDSKLAKKLETGGFIVTAEHAPGATAAFAATEAAMKALGGKPVVVNVADNQHGVAMSAVAAAAAVMRSGGEPVLQMVTRDRNRLALQSDLLGAASLGVRNVLCLSGYHQTLIGCPESANVFDIDSTQLIAMATRMAEQGELADGTKIAGPFTMLVGAVANPFLKPLELNLLRLSKKIEAGARFIQTHAVFDVPAFSEWLAAVRQAGLTKKAAILASVFPLESAAEAQKLRETYTDFCIPNEIVERLKASGQNGAQKKEGLAICVDTIKKLKGLEGLRGIHLLSGGREAVVPEILAASGL